MHLRTLFALISLFALGCPSTSTPDAGPLGIDAALPGTFSCAAATCAEGEICVSRRNAGFATDTGPSPDDAGTMGSSCEPRPAACGSQGDCTRSSCDPACAEAVCMPVAPFHFPELMVTDEGRRYECVNNQDAV